MFHGPLHLASILAGYVGTLIGRIGEDALVERVTRYLPVYTAWSVLMGFGLPLVFDFA